MSAQGAGGYSAVAADCSVSRRWKLGFHAAPGGIWLSTVGHLVRGRSCSPRADCRKLVTWGICAEHRIELDPVLAAEG